MPARPLADRVAGLDDAILKVAADADLDAAVVDRARLVTAVSVRRLGDLLDYLEGGGQPALLVADGVVPFWPDDAEVDGHLPRHGIETAPVAAAVIAELGAEASAAVAACEAVIPLLRPVAEESFAAAVALESLEAVVFTYLISPS